MSAVRSTALRAGGACVRCRKGKTKCVYENGRAPCKNCAKGMHDCYLPSESMSHGGHGVSPARVQSRARESLPAERNSGAGSNDRQSTGASASSRLASGSGEKLTPELLAECERVVSKTLPACGVFHKPSFLQQLKNASLEPTMIQALLTTAARHSPQMIRRYGSHGGASGAAEHFAAKAVNLIMQAMDQPSIADIQALCLLVIHEWGCRNAVRAYIYLGQAARVAQMYRVVHSHNQQADAEQFLHDESFRRTVWLIYILDCFLTSSPGRQPALSAHDIDGVALPCPDMNYHFGSPVAVRTLAGGAPSSLSLTSSPPMLPMSDVGEFGHIVLATRAWRNVVEMMTTTTLDNFSEEQCRSLEHDVDAIRQSLPIHFADKPGQISLHITMGSGYTYAMVHCLLNCATIFVNRRRILQTVTSDTFSLEQWRMAAQAEFDVVDRILTASHNIIQLLLSLEHGADKDSILCFPIFMLFSAFTAGSTVAYLSLKGMAPASVAESTVAIVRDTLRFMSEGSESWPLVVPWHRHLAVMSKVLRDAKLVPRDLDHRDELSKVNGQQSPSIKDDAASQPEAMDYDSAAAPPPAPSEAGQPVTDGRGSEPPVPRHSGFTTINGGGGPAGTGATTPQVAPSPPPSGPTKTDDSPAGPGSPMSASGGAIAPSTNGQEGDMTAVELCSAFERQLLELDDLAAFMGGGV